MRRTLLPLLVLLAFSTASAAASQETRWESDWDAAFARAKAENKLVFVDFYANWCPPCVEMDTSVFPQPDVREQMKDLVLLRVNVDRKSMTANKQHIRVLPTYIVFDPAQRERVRFSGGMPLVKFLAAMTEVRNAAPTFLQASASLDAGRAAEGWILVGNGYARLRMGEKARAAFKTASAEAAKSGDAATAKIADAQSAFTWAVDGKSARCRRELAALTATQVAPYPDALTWVLSARAAELAKDPKSARDCYERAIAVAPPGLLLDQAKASLAKLAP